MKRIHFLVIAVAILMSIAAPEANLSQARSLPGLLLANPSSASAKTLRLSAALGGKIVWSSSNRPNNRFELYSINPDSLAITPITDNTLSEGEPAWSPDGWKIAFDAYVSDNHELFVINADGSGQKQITLGYSCSSPQWSPDGTQISFTNYESGHNRVYVINPDGTGATPLTPPVIGAQNAIWSPDGSMIAYYAWHANPVGIYTIHPDGSHPTLLYALASLAYMDWSPNGQYLVITDSTAHLAVRDLVNATSLTITPASNIWEIDKASWSPDGQHIVFDAHATIGGSPQNDLYVIDSAGNNLTPLTQDWSYDQMPDWGIALARLYLPMMVK